MKPKLRFNEFNDEWNKVKISSIVQELKIKTGNTEKYPLWSLTIENGVTPKTDRYERSFLVKKDDNYKIVEPNNYVYNPMNAHLGAIARNKSNTTISVSGYYDIFKINNKNYSFYDNYFVSPVMFKQYKLISTGSLLEKQRVHYSQFKELEINLPTNKEQVKISNFLSLLDKKIELQSKKIEDLKLFKKGLNKYIFRNNCCNYQLKELLIEYNNKTTNNNEYEILSSTADGIVLQSEYFNKQAASQDTTGYKVVPRGYITYRSMSDTGEFHFNEQKIVDFGIVSPAYPVFKINEKIVNKNYILYYMNENKDFSNQILSTKEGGTRFALSFTKLLSLSVKLPNEEEQENFSKILYSIDKKIIFENDKLIKLNELKKGLMQNMFV